MNLNFPSRFLKKLEIYQLIRGDQGITKYKRLWKYEAAFLQTAYGKGHQHLSNFVRRTNFKRWIEETTPFDPKKDENELNHIIANLFWRGYVDIVERVNEKRDKDAKEKILNGLQLLNRKTLAFKSNAFGDDKKWDYRPTEEGLLVGEVLSEINNKNSLIRFWNRYKYDFILDTIWLLVFLVLARFIFGDEFIGNLIDQFRISWKGISFDSKTSLLILILGLPFISRFCRKLYSHLED